MLNNIISSINVVFSVAKCKKPIIRAYRKQLDNIKLYSYR